MRSTCSPKLNQNDQHFQNKAESQHNKDTRRYTQLLVCYQVLFHVAMRFLPVGSRQAVSCCILITYCTTKVAAPACPLLLLYVHARFTSSCENKSSSIKNNMIFIRNSLDSCQLDRNTCLQCIV